MVCRELLEKKIGNYQHGFVRNRGCQSAIRTLIEELRKEKMVYQFDLDGFFNNVNPRGLNAFLKKDLGRGLADYILSITDLTIPRLKADMDLLPEKELRKLPDGSILKGGYTQGSPLSPLLSIYALERAGFGSIPGLLMYADDGLVLRDETSDVERELFNLKARVLGVKKAEDKKNG
jgi:hypothetical protein